MSALRIRYQTVELHELDIHLRGLRDRSQFEDEEGEAKRLGISSAAWPMFGVLWDSSRVLAQLMTGHDVEGKRILEVGCGLGLASLVLNHREADITATDHHPEAGEYLEANVALNIGRAIPFVRTGWTDEDAGLGLFDLIIGSDLLYEQQLVLPLAAFVQRHAKPDCEVIIVDPGREHRGRFSRAMAAHGFACTRSDAAPQEQLEAPFTGQVLSFQR
jgi:predicted nicotinamide N-methyase